MSKKVYNTVYAMPDNLIDPVFSKNAISVLEKRYLKRDEANNPIETPKDMLWRVACVIAAGDKKDKAATIKLAVTFYTMMAKGQFLPNSPTLMNAGRELGQLSACFVLPVGDSMDEIFESVKSTALIHKSGGGTGFSFSRLRPANDVVMSTSGISSGPLSFMRVFDVATETIKQGGTRRGANMAILSIHHPDILSFIDCKLDKRAFNNFNISVGLTEPFMEAVEHDQDYPIINPRTGEVVTRIKAREVFNKIVKNAWENGEPGIIFLDRLNRDNPTPHVGEIESTNPCGEQPLLPYEACNLGSIDLGKLVVKGKFDYELLKKLVHSAVRFLDNVVEVNNYPIEQIDITTRANRKIGLGVMGYADALIKQQLSYGSEEAIEFAEAVMAFIQKEGRVASRELAKERGPFANYKGSTHDVPGAEPMRNATVTTIAPTGTISIIGNSSSGVEPLFGVAFIRNQADKIMKDYNPLFVAYAKEHGFYSEELMEKINDNHGSVYGIEEVPVEAQRIFVTAHDINPEAHILTQAAFQRHTDNAVSKTVNFSSHATEDDVRKAYMLAYQTGCKGVTIYRDGSRDEQVLSTGSTGKAATVETVAVPPAPARIQKRDRPADLAGRTYSMTTGCGPLFVTINSDEQGLFEVFTTMGKAGGCAASQCEAIGRMVSLNWRTGVDPEQTIKQLLGITCHMPAGFGENKVTSCADALAKAIARHIEKLGGCTGIKSMKVVQHTGGCPECGGIIEPEGGCAVCRACGYSECA